MEELPKRPDLKEIEERCSDFWKKEKLYEFDFTSEAEVYSIDTPPIYPSGTMHMGHTMSYNHIEFLARYWRMRGKNVFFPACFDDNGLPTEKYVEELNKVSKATVKKEEFRKMCFDVSTELEKQYAAIFRALGFSMAFNICYRTIGDYAQRQAQRSFIDLFRKNQVYRKEEPTIWCPFHQTALAQAEVEDQDKKTYLNYIEFELVEGNNINIATTRPELLPSCVAIVVNPEDKSYGNCIGKEAIVPIFGHKVKIISDEKVDPNFGTGAVMVCTFGDKTDIEWWKTHRLPLRISITKDGKLNSLANDYEGLSVQDARKKIIADLKNKKAIYKQEELDHTVGVCWRCKNPVEFIVTKQWFVNVLEHKEKLVELGRKLNWYPEHFRVRYEDWVTNLKWDWCISRQRYYGIPIPVWYCKKCNEIILADENKLPVNPENKIPDRCPRCESLEITPEIDVFDTWFTSSITPLINTKWMEDENFFCKTFPMSLRPNGHDIIRTWIFYTVLKSYLHEGRVPWRDVMISGHGLDSKGKKMSKSLGNIVEPTKVIGFYGADAVRLWATTSKVGEDLAFKEDDLKHNKDLLTKIWNSSRFVSLSLEKTERPELTIVDNWILSRLKETTNKYHEYFETYRLSEARKEIEMFFKHEFCDYYLEMVKYRIYGEDEALKNAAKWTLYEVLLGVLKLFAPFVPFLSEELYQKIFKSTEKEKSLHISRFSEVEVEESKLKESLIIGELLKKLISEIRTWKISNQISLGKEIKKVEITWNKASIEELKKVVPDIKGTNKVKEVVFMEGEFRIKCFN